jgi:hypothetical protein
MSEVLSPRFLYAFVKGALTSHFESLPLLLTGETVFQEHCQIFHQGVQGISELQSAIDWLILHMCGPKCAYRRIQTMINVRMSTNCKSSRKLRPNHLTDA